VFLVSFIYNMMRLTYGFLLVIRYQTIVLFLLIGYAFSISAFAEHTIPVEEIKVEEIFAGDAASFTKPAEIDMNALILSTPEYNEIKKKKLDKGTGKYWILRNQATERAHKAIIEVVNGEDYDFIANEGYLGSLATPIDCENLTKKALKIIKK
jgi:hypothetical protein